MGNTWSLEDVKTNLVADKFNILYDQMDLPNFASVGEFSLRNTWEACDTRKCKNMTSCTYCNERVPGQQLLEIIFNGEEPIFTSTVTIRYSGRPFYVIDYSFRTGLSINLIFQWVLFHRKVKDGGAKEECLGRRLKEDQEHCESSQRSNILSNLPTLSPEFVSFAKHCLLFWIKTTNALPPSFLFVVCARIVFKDVWYIYILILKWQHAYQNLGG